MRRSWFGWLAVAAACACGSAAADELALPVEVAAETTDDGETAGAIDPDDILAGDTLIVHLVQGGTIEGRALSWAGNDLRIRTADGDSIVDRQLIEHFELAQRTGIKPMPQVDEIPPGESEEGRRLRRLNRARATGLGVASFFIPGLGQFATGQPALGSTYLFGTLVVDTVLVLSIVINQDPILAVVLGALELAARITSAGLAAGAVRKLAVWVAPTGGARRGSTGVMAGIQLAFR